jgi:hypothetical protein
MKINGSIVPEAIVEAYQDYGFDKPIETALATRTAQDWYAILFKDGGHLYAVDFYPTSNGWDVSNDFIGPFESVDEFLTEPLTRSFV